MNKESFIAALIMLKYKRLTPISTFPTKLYKDDINVHVYNKNIIVRLKDNTKNYYLTQDLEKLEKFLKSKTENDYGWTKLGSGTNCTFRNNGFKTQTKRTSFKTKIIEF